MISRLVRGGDGDDGVAAEGVGLEEGLIGVAEESLENPVGGDDGADGLVATAEGLAEDQQVGFEVRSGRRRTKFRFCRRR